MIDNLQVSGGYWKEQRRRHLECLIRHSSKIKKELEEKDKE